MDTIAYLDEAGDSSWAIGTTSFLSFSGFSCFVVSSEDERDEEDDDLEIDLLKMDHFKIRNKMR